LKGDIVSGIITIVFGLFFFIGSIDVGITAKTSDQASGAGLFPFVVSLFLILFGFILLIKGFRSTSKESYLTMDEDTKENLKPFILTIVAVIIFLVIIKFLPFMVALFILLVFLNWIYKRNLKFNLIFSSLVIIFVYTIFVVLLNVQFQV
jgi:sterol desaturase/sphingolipid hydroxylase (fatty acid hydroxylase superfamily)